MIRLKLSIIVPVYNVESFIVQCLDSLYTSPDKEHVYEVLIINDGTKDNSISKVEPYVNHHGNIHVLHQKNQGLSVARNTGLFASKGEYVWFVDSDDWLTADAVANVLDLLNKYDGIDMLTMPLRWSYADKNLNHTDIKLSKDTLMTGLDYINRINLTGAIQRNIIRRELLERADIKFYPGILHEDDLFGMQIFYQANSVLVLKDSLYNYRQRSGSIMSSRTIKSAYDLIMVHKQLSAYEIKYVKPEHKKWFRQKIMYLFPKAIGFVWHLRHTSEFRRFQCDSWNYRIKQSFFCLFSCGKVGIAKALVYGFFPYLYIWFINHKENTKNKYKI